MKHFYFKFFMAFFAMIFSFQLDAATTVVIDSIKYELNGTEAYVTGYTGHPVNVVIPRKSRQMERRLW